MAVSCNEVSDYGGLGRALHMTDGTVELYTTLDFGPRIIHCSLAGEKNLFWINPDHAMEVENLDETYHRGQVYSPVGGHRLWVSPEHPVYSYFPDTDPVTCELIPNGAVFTPPVRPVTGDQHRMQVTLCPDSHEISVTCSLTNTSSAPMTAAPWCVSQLAPGGMEIIPQSKRDTGLLPDRFLSVWPYTDMGDARLGWGDDFITVTPDRNITRALKLGLRNLDAWALYLTGHTALLKRFDVKEGGVYPDGGVSYETYCNEFFLEMETLGELVTLAPGKTTSQTERWTLSACSALPGGRDWEAVRRAVENLL